MNLSNAMLSSYIIFMLHIAESADVASTVKWMERWYMVELMTVMDMRYTTVRNVNGKLMMTLKLEKEF